MPRKQKIIQRGGMHGTPFPSEIYGKNSGRYFAEGSPNLNIGGSAYGVNLATSRGTLIGNNQMGPDLGPTGHSGTQTGGARRRSKTQINRRRSKTQLGGARRRSKTRINSARRHSKIQTGGSPFKMITNPETGRKVSIHGSIGRKVLTNYLKR